MNKSVTLLGAFGIGAGLMYLLDPDRGKRRRAVLRDRARAATNDAARRFAKRNADLRNRLQGAWLETEKLFENDLPTDEQLEGQVRTRLGRRTSHPHAVKTTVENGTVTLSGVILADEIKSVLDGVAAVNGVKAVENRLEAHASRENIASLQGENRVRRAIVRRNEENWTPAKRLLAATAGGSLIALGAKKRDALGSLGASVGTALLTRSAVNLPLKKLLARSGSKTIRVQKAINIDAPPARVFEVLKHPQYFPNFMAHVRSVRQTDEKTYVWTYNTLGGFTVEWTVEVTEVLPDELIRWKIVGDDIEQPGFWRLERAAAGKTRLHIEMNYHPFGGSFGHFVAAALRQDPKTIWDDDFLRLKTYIEKGKLPRDAAAVVEEKRRKEMKVSEIMTKNPVYVTLDASLHEVAQKMAETDCGVIPVLGSGDTKKPVGVITDRDLVLRTIAHNKNPLQMIVAEVMTDTVLTVSPEMSVEECIEVMEKNQLRRVLVVDDAGHLTGIVAQADVARNAPSFETAELVKDVSMRSAA